MIAPGETVVVLLKAPWPASEAKVETLLEVPTLSPPCDAWHPWRVLRWRLGYAAIARWRPRIEPGICAKDRRRIRTFFEQHRPRAVLAEYGPNGYFLWRICRRCKVPLFVHFHGFDASMLLQDKHWRRRYRLMFRAATGLIAPSEYLGSRLLAIGCPDSKLHVIPCGVDVQRFVPSHRLPGRILAVGRLVEKKAPHLAIEAFSHLRQRFPGAELDMVGEGPLRDRCMALIRDLKLGNRVRIHGARPHEFVTGLMQQASLFVQHSVTGPDGDTEGLPVAILEAMSAALPVVSTRHSGIPEAVEEGVTGLLVDEHDVSGMADAMAQLLGDSGRAAAMGMAGRQRVISHFTQERACNRLRTLMGLRQTATTEARPI
jgi:glycosyltransferase involved in cell wall biosynthesis